MFNKRFFFLSALLVLATIAVVYSQSVHPDDRTGRLIVKFRTRVDRNGAQQACQHLGGRFVDFRNDMQIGVIDGANLGLSGYRSQDSHIQYIEPEIRMYEMNIPNDPFFSSQWGMQDTGYGIRLPSAREFSLGMGVTVAVVDTGIRRDCPDLQGTTVLPGHDFVNNDNDARDDNGHGTHVSGTIAQTTDNQYGCAGIAPKATLLAVKVLSSNGWGTNLGVAQGIRYAADQGARVINMSLGGAASQTLQDAVSYAVGKGVVICAAAGNGGGQGLSYPAAYSQVISVGAIDRNGVKASFSQYGNGLTLVAPGVSVLQQTMNSSGAFQFLSFSGTSMATPHVAGVVALVRAKNPGLTPDQVKTLLSQSARDLGPSGYDINYGAGEVDAAAALARAGSPTPVPTPTPTPTPTPSPTPPTELQQVLDLVNQERAKVGVPALTWNANLGKAAQTWSQYMADHSYFSHFAPDGSGPGQRISATGYVARTWGENIAAGYSTPQAVMQAWMNSSGHRANILNGSFKEIGIGVARVQQSTYGVYWTEDFAAR